MSAADLRGIQELFWKLVTAPEGTAAGLRDLGLTPEALGAVVRGDERLGAVERVDVYADMYFYRLLDVLHADYPKLLAVLGGEAFHDLATDYLLASPSRHPSLRYLGERLPAYLADHPLGAARPWLAELAHLEWARVDVFDRADASLLARADLARVPPESWPALRLPPVPALRLLALDHPVQEVWAALERAGEAPEPPARPTYLRVWRHDLGVYHAPIDGTEHAALTSLSEGATWAEVCERLADTTGADLEAAVQTGLSYLLTWLEEGLLAAPGEPGSAP